MRIAGVIVLLTFVAAPAFGQEANRNDPKDTKPEARNAYRGIQVGDQPANPDAEKLRAELKSLEAVLEQKMAEMQKIKAQIEQVRARINTVGQPANKEAKPDTMRVWLDIGDPKQGPQEIILRHVDGAWQIAPAKDNRGDDKSAKPGWQVQPKGPGLPPAVIWGPDGGPKGAGFPPGVIWGPDGGKAPQVRPDTDQRIDNLEKKLDKLMNALEQMRKEMDGPRKKAASEEETARHKAVEALNRIAEDKKNADFRAVERAEEAKRAEVEKAEEAERKAIKERYKSVQDELDRVNALRRELEAELKKAEENKKKEIPR